MPTSPQIGLRQSIVLNQSDILTLYSVGKIIVPAESGYANVPSGTAFVSLFYTYKTAVFTNVDNVIGFYLVPSVGDPVLISNLINGINILGIPQNTSMSFSAANPYISTMADSDNCSIMIKMSGSDPVGGDTKSTLSVTINYSILQIS